MYNEAAGIVPRNVVEACAWWMLAEAQGNRDALRNLEDARKTQPVEILASAKIRADQLRNKIVAPTPKK
jgi:hypothetical protein